MHSRNHSIWPILKIIPQPEGERGAGTGTGSHSAGQNEDEDDDEDEHKGSFDIVMSDANAENSTCDFVYKALKSRDALHIKHNIIRKLRIYSLFFRAIYAIPYF